MIQLEQRQLGASGISVSALGVGVWSWGDTGFWNYGQTHTQDDITQAYRTSLDANLNFFDSAEIYGSGASERLLGECIRQDSRPIIVATKFAPLPQRITAGTLLKALDNSLARLGVECIDLYQIHWPYTLIPVHALMDALAEAVRQGKVRAVGVSNYSAELMRKAHARLARHNIPLASNQVHYSLLHRKPETNGVLAACQDMGIALIAYSPLEQGLLTGKFRTTTTDTVIGWRAYSPLFWPGQRRKMEPLLQTLEKIAHAREKTSGQVALNWLLTKGECIIPIPGAKNARQARENAGALGWRLTEQEQEEIHRAALPWLP